MVTRVSTTGNYASILSNLMGAQLRQFDANERVSSQKNGNDLKDYAKKASPMTCGAGWRDGSTRSHSKAANSLLISLSSSLARDAYAGTMALLTLSSLTLRLAISLSVAATG